MQFLMKLRSKYEVVRANMLDRKTYHNMDSVFSELLREETRITTQAALKARKKSTLFFWPLKARLERMHEIFQKFNVMNVRTLATLYGFAIRKTTVFIARSAAILLECRVRPQKNDQPKSTSKAYQATAEEQKN